MIKTTLGTKMNCDVRSQLTSAVLIDKAVQLSKKHMNSHMDIDASVTNMALHTYN